MKIKFFNQDNEIHTKEDFEMNLFYIAAIVLSIVGCGGSSPETQQVNQCASHFGTFNVHYDLDNSVSNTRNDCGNIADQVVKYSSQPKSATDISANCSGSLFTSADDCTENFNIVCNVGSAEQSQSFNEVQNLTWDNLGHTANGNYFLTVKDFNGNVMCEGKYLVFYTKVKDFMPPTYP